MILISIYSNIRNTIPQMNFLIHFHQICFYLTFHIQKGSMVNQGLSVVTYFPINKIKRQFLVTYHLQLLIMFHNFFLFYQCCMVHLLLNQIYMKGTGLNLTKKVLYWTILKKIGMTSQIPIEIILIYHSIIFWRTWMNFLISLHLI